MTTPNPRPIMPQVEGGEKILPLLCEDCGMYYEWPVVWPHIGCPDCGNRNSPILRSTGFTPPQLAELWKSGVMPSQRDEDRQSLFPGGPPTPTE